MGTIGKLVFILPSFNSGGMERVASILINYCSENKLCDTYLILSSPDEIFYELSPNVKVIRPDFNYKNFNRLLFTKYLFSYLRRTLFQLKPDYIISFGGRFNSFNLLASIGLNSKIFISDRSHPEISYGYWLDKLNRIMYRHAYGIIAQTQKAAEVHTKRIKHKNIKVIGNPIYSLESNVRRKENIILNVGRFISTKNQDKLIDYFNAVSDSKWRLLLLGDGKYFDKCLQHANESKLSTQIKLPGVVKNVNEYYANAAIFAFTSTSEGFPNALAEAMAAGCACISFDCVAGPSDLIDDGINGFLIPVGNDAEYINKLQMLMNDPALRKTFGEAAIKKMEKYRVDIIAEQYLNFMLT